MLDILLGNQVGFFKGVPEICSDIPDSGNLVQKCGALVVEVEAAVVQINSSDNRGIVVAEEYLGVDEARRVLVNFHAGIQE